MKTKNNSKAPAKSPSITDTLRVAKKGQVFTIPAALGINPAQAYVTARQCGAEVETSVSEKGITVHVLKCAAPKPLRPFKLENKPFVKSKRGRPVGSVNAAKPSKAKSKAKPAAKPAKAKVSAKAAKSAKAKAILAKPIKKPAVRVSKKAQEEMILLG